MEQTEPLKIIKKIFKAVSALEEWKIETARADFERAKAEYEKYSRKRKVPSLKIYLRYCHANGKLEKAEKLYPALEENFEKLKAEYGGLLSPQFWNVKDLLVLEGLLRERKIASLSEGENYLNNK